MTSDIEMAYQRGFELRCNGQYAEAQMYFQKVLSVDPTHANSLHQVGLIQGFLGDFDGSYATLLKLSTQFPSNLSIRYDLAMTQMMLGMNDEACANFRQILSVDPSHQDASRQVIYC